jgi:hypothetical protein
MCCCAEQEWLLSMLDINELLVLRFVSQKTKEWVDAIMWKRKRKPFTLSVDETTALHELVNEESFPGIPLFRGLHILPLLDTDFFFLPLIPEFLRIYGPQIHTISRPGILADVVPEEVAFYQALPNLIQLSVPWLGDDVRNVKMPALERLQLLSLYYLNDDITANINFDFLLNFPNLRQLWLCYTHRWYESVGVLSDLVSYFAVRNGREGPSSGRTLLISIDSHHSRDYHFQKLNPTEEVKRLLQELVVADGRILIESMPVTLLDEAVFLFRHQRGGQIKLRSFGKCIRSLKGFSSSLYEVELPNMWKLEVCWASEGAKAREGDYSRKVIWPTLKEVELDVGGEKDVSYLPKLVFGNGVVRPSVKRFGCNLKLLSLGSKEAHLGLANLPNLTRLKLKFGAADVRLFRSLMRVLPTSCRKIQFLHLLHANSTLGEEDFLGMDEEGINDVTPPLLQFPGK